MFTLESQAKYYSCVILAYPIRIPQRFCAKYFLQNLKILICSHFIAQNVQQGLMLKTPNGANPVEFTLYILQEDAVIRQYEEQFYTAFFISYLALHFIR